MIVVGINHKIAPIQVREKFFLSSLEQDLFLSELKCDPSIVEAFVLSTCNRTEVYANVLDERNHFSALIQLLAKIKKQEFSPETVRMFYSYTGKEALQHLLRVVCGLDSLVLGERQILGQVKTAVERAQGKGMFTKTFNILSNIAIRTGKKAQTETDISFGGSSVSWAALMMAEELLGNLKGKSFLIIGAGKMGEMAIGQIHSKGVSKIYLMNRTHETAEALASQYQGIPVAFSDIKEILTEVDVGVCSVGAPHYILEKSTVQKVMTLRNDRKLILLDISMPRNIDPQVATLQHVHLSCIDDLRQVVGETMRKRQAAVRVVEGIIRNKLNEFYEKLGKAQHPLSQPPLVDSEI